MSAEEGNRGYSSGSGSGGPNQGSGGQGNQGGGSGGSGPGGRGPLGPGPGGPRGPLGPGGPRGPGGRGPLGPGPGGRGPSGPGGGGFGGRSGGFGGRGGPSRGGPGGGGPGGRGGPRKPPDPMLMGVPSPSLGRINKMNMVALTARIQTLETEAVRLNQKIENLKAHKPCPEDRVKQLSEQIVRLQALLKLAKDRLAGKAARKEARESGKFEGRR